MVAINPLRRYLEPSIQGPRCFLGLLACSRPPTAGFATLQGKSNPMSELKLIALDAEDLRVISAHLQDAVGRTGDIAYQPAWRRFALVLNRFDWTTTASETAKSPRSGRTKETYTRRQTALRFEKVNKVRSTGIDRSREQDVLSLLAVGFDEGETPSGTVTLYFSGGPQIALEVECIEAELRDLSAAWATNNLPEHPDGRESE